MAKPDTNVADPETLALTALAWTLAEPDRAGRLLALTGIEPGTLRARATEPGMLAAILAFLENHEPDLIACADALDCRPADLVTARAILDGSAR